MFPILYESGPISIQTLWVFVVIALLTSSALAVRRLKRRRVQLTLFIEKSGFMLLSAFVLSRIVFFVFHTDTYFPGLDIRTLYNFFAIWDQGFSFWGGLFGFTSMLIYQLIKAKEPIWRWLDALIVPLYVGMIIGYMGAFLGGYAYGSPTDLPWGIQYEVTNVKYTVPIHPTQIYAILLLSAGLLSKYFLLQKTSFLERDGNSTLYLSAWLFLSIFLLEFVRGDDTLALLNIRLAQYLFLPLFIGSLAWLIQRYRKLQNHEHSSS